MHWVNSFQLCLVGKNKHFQLVLIFKMDGFFDKNYYFKKLSQYFHLKPYTLQFTTQEYVNGTCFSQSQFYYFSCFFFSLKAASDQFNQQSTQDLYGDSFVSCMKLNGNIIILVTVNIFFTWRALNINIIRNVFQNIFNMNTCLILQI